MCLLHTPRQTIMLMWLKILQKPIWKIERESVFSLYTLNSYWGRGGWWRYQEETLGYIGEQCQNTVCVCFTIKQILPLALQNRNISANRVFLPNAVSLLAQRLRRWANIETALGCAPQLAAVNCKFWLDARLHNGSLLMRWWIIMHRQRGKKGAIATGK